MVAQYQSVAGNTVAAAVSSNACGKPSGTASSDLLVAMCTDGGSITDSFAAPDGSWTAGDTTPGGGLSGVGNGALFYKIAGGSEPSSYTFTRGGSTGVFVVQIVRVSGADTTTPVADSNITGSGSSGSTTPATGGVTAANSDTLLLQMLAVSTTSTSVTQPAGSTEVYDTTTSGTVRVIAGATETVGPGATGNRVWTLGGSIQWRGAQVAVNPAASPPPTTVNLGVATRAATSLALTVTVGAVVPLGVAERDAEALPVAAQAGQVIALGVAARTSEALPLTVTVGAHVTLGVASRAAEALPVDAQNSADGITVALGVAERTATALPLDVDPGYAQTIESWSSGRQRDGIATWSWSPAVEPIPPHLGGGGGFGVAAAWVTALAFDTPVVTNGRPIVAVSSATERKTRHRITIGGVDVTFLRGVPTPEMDYQLLEPGMYGPGSLVLPQVYAYFEQPGMGDLSWLTDFAPVVQQRVDADGNVVGTDYRGFILTYDGGDDGLRIECGGELTGRLALTEKQIPLFRRVRDIGAQVHHLVNTHGCTMRPAGGPDIGIQTLAEGGTSSLDAFNRLNALAATRTGAQYSTMPDADGIYRLERKDLTTIHATCYAHDGQQPASLRRDLTEETSRVYGTGVTPNGLRVLNPVYPGLALYTEPADYPMAGGGSFGEGTTNAETASGDGITVLITRLHHSNLLGEVEDLDAYDEEVAEAVEALQERAGLAVTGVVNQATWRALWDQDVVNYSMFGSTILPMAQKGYTKRWRRSAQGAIIGRNPNYDPTIPPVDRNIDYGTGFRKPQMVRWSKREIDQSDANWVGTISVETGALVAGDHTPGDPIASIIHATDIRPGMNVSLPLFMGGVVAHVSAVSVSGGKVTLSVDTRARDTIPVWEVIRRNRESRRNPHRAWVRDHLSSGNISDAIIEFSEGGGIIDDVQLNGDGWTVFPAVSGRSGTVGRLRISLNAEREFAVAVFGERISEKKLDARIGNPLSEGGQERWQDNYREFDREHLILYSAGSPEDPCGYSPKSLSQSPSAPITGNWFDDAGFEYRTGPSNVLWVAVWCALSPKVRGGRIMWPKLEPM